MESKEVKSSVKKNKQNNISLILDSYNDIFSDFDSRGYSEKALSDDFLAECKRAARDKEPGFELILSVPKSERNTKDETSVKKRLKNHFERHYTQQKKEIHAVKKDGIKWIIAGSILLILSAILETYTENFLINLAMVITIPSGWFGFWEGLNKIFIRSEEKEPEAIFYKKMNNANILFIDY